jgi:hypothetical protein
MSFEIIGTANGPIIKSGEAILTLQEIADLIEIAEEHDVFIPELKVHIANGMISAAQEWSEALIENLSPQTSSVRLTAYQNAGAYFRSFDGHYRNYLAQKAASSAE